MVTRVFGVPPYPLPAEGVWRTLTLPPLGEPSIEKVTRGSSFHTLHIYTHCALYPLLASRDSKPTGFMVCSWGLLALPRACPSHYVWLQG